MISQTISGVRCADATLKGIFDTELINHAGCRFWDKNEFKNSVIRSLDKDVFRKGTGDLAAYGELFKRLQKQEEM